MRKKALLAGALSGFEGPWVNLEVGEWLVEPSPDFELKLYESTVTCISLGANPAAADSITKSIIRARRQGK